MSALWTGRTLRWLLVNARSKPRRDSASCSTNAALVVSECSPAVPVRFIAPTDADSLVDALVAGQLSPRTRRASASDLAELVSVLERWGLRLSEVSKDHLHAYRAWLAGEDVRDWRRNPLPLLLPR